MPTPSLHIRHGLFGRVYGTYQFLWCWQPCGDSYLAAALLCWHMWSLWSTKTPNFFSSCGFYTSQFSISLFLCNYCFKHKFRTLKLMLLFNINVNTNSWHLLEMYHVDLVGFSPVVTLWDCFESCFFPFLFSFPGNFCLSVCQERCLHI